MWKISPGGKQLIKKTKKVGKVETLDQKKFSVFGYVETDKNIIKISMDDDGSDLRAELRSWEKVKVASTRKSLVTGQIEHSSIGAILANEWCLIARGNPVGIYMFKVNDRNTRTRCEIRSKLTIKTPEQHQASFWCLYC